MGRAIAAGNVRCVSLVSAELPHTTSGQKGPIKKNALSVNPLPSCRGLTHMGIWWLYDMAITK